MPQKPMTPAAEFMTTTVAYYTYLSQSSPEALPTDALSFPDIETLTACVTRSGNTFFTEPMMARWGTELFPALFGQRFFVTWDRDIQDGGAYSVRWTYRYADGQPKVEVTRFDRTFDTELEARHFAHDALRILWPEGA